ncbi:alpha/beta fold hydrolase [Archangium violaceum]|uniref:alpha/beta hydrolase family protein n=1 Tax=Archangium violaceum TaxID=83451 RepID=UPI00194DC773|nr:alpha/beta fold hydrolase [Archangium violaceum]QRN98040.1 alpha/beta fold hydrolase [Archangium violaceum]
MSLQTSRMSLAGAPALVVHRGPREEALRRGVVLFFHGLGASKEVNERELGVFADRGLVAVGLDAMGHGERRYPDFDARFTHDNPRAEEDFLQVVRATANEVPSVLDALVSLGADAERLSIGGASLGGFITYRALLLDRRLRVAVPLIGSPEWELPLPESPHCFPERFFPVALFSQTAGLDDVVHPGMARAFHERLVPLYAQAPERLRYREFPLSRHRMRPEDWNEAIQDAADWLVRFLGVERSHPSRNAV